MNQREAQAAESRRKLLEAAKDLFLEKGYGKTTIRDINRMVGLADGISYHYFPGGKQEIFQRVVEDSVQQVVAALSEKNRVDAYTDMPLAEAMDQIITNFSAVIEAHLGILRILVRENEAQAFIVHDELINNLWEGESWFVALLREKHARGEVREMDFDSAAMALQALLMNHVLMKVMRPGISRLDDPRTRERIIAYQVALWKSQ